MSTPSDRIAQSTGPAGTFVRIVDTFELPEVSQQGQLLFARDDDRLYVYDGVGWQAIGDESYSRTWVGTTDPALSNTIPEGDLWLNPVEKWLKTRVDGAWVNPAVPPNSIGEDQLKVDAITSKHTITGPFIRTSSDGNRVELTETGDQGVVYFHTGEFGESPGYIIPVPNYAQTGHMLRMASGYSSSRPSNGYINLSAGSGTHGYIDLVGRVLISGANGSYLVADEALFKTVSLGHDGGVNSVTGRGIVATTSTGHLNVRVHSTNYVMFSETSALKHKLDVEPLDLAGRSILNVVPIRYRDRHEVEAHEAGEEGWEAEPGHYVGFSSESFIEAGFEDLVVFVDGEPESLAYERVTALIVAEAKQKFDQMQDRIDALEARLSALEAR